MKSILFPLFSCFVLIAAAQPQQGSGRLDIDLNNTILKPGDSLRVQVTYRDTANQASAQSLATVELIIENSLGMRTRLRWPVINGLASGALYLPDSLPQGRYTLVAGLQQRFFEVVGTVAEAKSTPNLQAMLLTKSGEWDEQEVPVARDGRFAIRNWLFEDDALVAFSSAKASKQPLNIRISTQLDSSSVPLAVAGRFFYVGIPKAAETQPLDQPVETSQTIFADKGYVLPAVVVRTAIKSRAEQFDEAYASSLFRSGDARLVSVLDDPSAIGYSNIFAYLQGRIAGLQIAPAGINGGVARWRGGPVTFFIDEMRVSAQQVASLPMADIAIVKAYPSPFVGAPGGRSGIAIYTRRGGEASFLPAGRQVFKVKGYTPASTALTMNTLGM